MSNIFFFALMSFPCLLLIDGQGQLYLPKWWLLSLSDGLVEWGSWEKEIAAIAWNIMRSSECLLVEVFTIWKPGLLSNPGNSVSGMMRKNSPSGFLEVSTNGTICIFMFFCFCTHVFYLKKTYCHVIGWFRVFSTFLNNVFVFLHQLYSVSPVWW